MEAGFFSGGCPAGLSVIQYERVTGKQPLHGDTLRNRKVRIFDSTVC